MSEIAVLSNPVSGTTHARARQRALDELRAATGTAGIDHLEPQASSDLPAALRRLAASGTRLLAIDGGDGTVVAVVTALRRHRPFSREPMLAVLAGGSTNLIARDAGCSGTTAAALRRIVDRWHACDGRLQTVERRPLVVHAAGTAPRYGFFLGGAAIPRLTAAARQRLYSRGIAGPLAWALTLGWGLWRLAPGRLAADPLLRPVPVRIACDDGAGETAPRIAVLVTTLDRLLLGLRPRPAGGGLGVAVVNAGAPGFWRRLPGALRRPWPTAVPGARLPYAAASCETVRLAGSPDWVLDGEPVATPTDGDLMVRADAPFRFLVA